MSEFIFSAIDVFPIYARGLVFRGEVQAGEAVEGDLLVFETSNGLEIGELSFIELDREGIRKTILNKDLGLLINNFCSQKSNRSFLDLPETEEEALNYPSVEDQLGIELPLAIKKAKKQ